MLGPRLDNVYISVVRFGFLKPFNRKYEILLLVAWSAIR